MAPTIAATLGQMTVRILLVEDDGDLRTAMADGLSADGYAVEEAADAGAALSSLAQSTPDLLILDVSLGAGVDGMEICRRVRLVDTTLYVMMLTARDAEADIVSALEAGADDYLTKPVGLTELRSRVRASLRRLSQLPVVGDAVLSAGPLRIDRNALTAHVEATPLHLTPSEFAVLRALLEAGGSVLTRWELVHAIFGDDAYRNSRAVDVHIHHVREKLADAGGDPGLIATVRGAGYRLAA